MLGGQHLEPRVVALVDRSIDHRGDGQPVVGHLAGEPVADQRSHVDPVFQRAQSRAPHAASERLEDPSVAVRADAHCQLPQDDTLPGHLPDQLAFRRQRFCILRAIVVSGEPADEQIEFFVRLKVPSSTNLHFHFII